MKKIDKLIFFIKNETIIHEQLIDDFLIEGFPVSTHFSTHLDKNNIEIKGEICLPNDFDYCYIITRPSDKEELSNFFKAAIFKPLFDTTYDGLKDVVVDPVFDVFIKRFKIYGLDIDNNGVGSYERFIAHF
jgi:ribosomal protein S10